MATIKDVAKSCGVSVATVSRVLNKSTTVRESTTQKVNEAIKKLNYKPNMLGKNLRQLQTRRILVILETISNPFYSKVVKGIEDRAREENFAVMICASRGRDENMLEHLKLLESKVVDGAIIMSMSTELARKKVKEVSLVAPIVCACEPNSIKSIPAISIDDFKASYDATNFLINSGHSDIVAFSGAWGSIGTKSSFYKRENGFKKSLSDNGIPFHEDMIIKAGISFNDARNAVSKMLNRKNIPSAIFAFSDSLAMGTIKELSEKGILVPENISVMGFDNTSMSEVFIPSITTVAQPQYDIGYTAMSVLLDKINSTLPTSKLTLTHQIVKRQSVLNK